MVPSGWIPYRQGWIPVKKPEKEFTSQDFFCTLKEFAEKGKVAPSQLSPIIVSLSKAISREGHDYHDLVHLRSVLVNLKGRVRALDRIDWKNFGLTLTPYTTLDSCIMNLVVLKNSESISKGDIKEIVEYMQTAMRVDKEFAATAGVKVKRLLETIPFVIYKIENSETRHKAFFQLLSAVFTTSADLREHLSKKGNKTVLAYVITQVLKIEPTIVTGKSLARLINYGFFYFPYFRNLIKEIAPGELDELITQYFKVDEGDNNILPLVNFFGRINDDGQRAKAFDCLRKHFFSTYVNNQKSAEEFAKDASGLLEVLNEHLPDEVLCEWNCGFAIMFAAQLKDFDTSYEYIREFCVEGFERLDPKIKVVIDRTILQLQELYCRTQCEEALRVAARGDFVSAENLLTNREKSGSIYNIFHEDAEVEGIRKMIAHTRSQIAACREEAAKKSISTK